LSPSHTPATRYVLLTCNWVSFQVQSVIAAAPHSIAAARRGRWSRIDARVFVVGMHSTVLAAVIRRGGRHFTATVDSPSRACLATYLTTISGHEMQMQQHIRGVGWWRQRRRQQRRQQHFATALAAPVQHFHCNRRHAPTALCIVVLTAACLHTRCTHRHCAFCTTGAGGELAHQAHLCALPQAPGHHAPVHQGHAYH
jgi:hypothetical protein